jgi:hypothetical protein
MVKAVAAKDVTLGELRRSLNLRQITEDNSWSELAAQFDALSPREEQQLDRVKENYLELMADPPLLENTVKMVVLAPLLDLAGFYYRPFRIETETGVDLELEDEGTL